jgi:hypothetical protein
LDAPLTRGVSTRVTKLIAEYMYARFGGMKGDTWMASPVSRPPSPSGVMDSPQSSGV